MAHTPIRALIVAVGAAAAAVVASGCSNSEGAANRQPYTGSTTAVAVAGVQEVTLTVNSGFRFTPSTVTVHPGKVRITLRHTGTTGAPHNWSLLGIPGDYVPDVDPGQSGSVSFVAPAPGRYEFVCTIHQRQGQTGTLVVLAG